MPQLPRAGRLLRSVAGKAHASADDHETAAPKRHDAKPPIATAAKKRLDARRSLPTPGSMCSSQSGKSSTATKRAINADEEDFDRDPESSSELENEGMNRNVITSSKTSDPLDMSGSDDRTGEAKAFKVLGAGQESRKRGKRGAEDNGNEEKALPDKKRKFVNIFAPEPRVKKQYGSRNAAKRRTGKGFKNESPLKSDSSHGKSVVGFKVLPVHVEQRESGPVFKSSFSSTPGAGDEFEDLDDVSSLSSPGKSPEPEAVEKLGLPELTGYCAVTQCGWCDEEVPKMVYEEFIDQNDLPEPMPFKWEARFCRHHKRGKAEKMRIARGYPNINWDRLGGRMRKHDEYLIQVLHNTTESHYRTAQNDKLQPRKKGVRQTWKAEDDKSGGSVGYYGPRGAKMMTDHIMGSLADQLREQATMDKLVSSSGVQGGVTGFVQAVLVPHLAELLIKDDMRLSGDWSLEARDIMAESTELGDLLHPEAGDKIAPVAEDTDDDENE